MTQRALESGIYISVDDKTVKSGVRNREYFSDRRRHFTRGTMVLTGFVMCELDHVREIKRIDPATFS